MAMIDQIGIVFIGLGVVFDVLGCLGMVRFPDIYNRLQAGAKCVTLGVCLILIGTVLMADITPTRLKAVVCIAFIVITSPTGAHALARAARHSGIELSNKSVVDRFEKEVK